MVNCNVSEKCWTLVGRNVSVSVSDAPGASVNDVLPGMKFGYDAVTDETTSVVFPGFVICSVSLSEVLIPTVPNDTLDGVTAMPAAVMEKYPALLSSGIASEISLMRTRAWFVGVFGTIHA